MKTLEAGYELDKAVAEACGWNTTCGAEGCCIWVEGRETAIQLPKSFLPSADWNDAMLAAEKCGLFREGHGDAFLSQADSATGWMVCSAKMLDIHHESGPVAICLAILKLKEAEA